MFGKQNLNIPKSAIDDFPMRELMKYDERFKTRYAFKADCEFDDSILRKIYKQDRTASKLLNNYFFSQMLGQTYNRYVGIQVVRNASELMVCYIYTNFFILCVWNYDIDIYTEITDKI